MGSTGIMGMLIILITSIISYKGFTNASFLEGYAFEVDKILINRDYKRLITSGFLHVSWHHLIFNMITLLCFSSSVEGFLGPVRFLVIYFASMVGGDLLALFIHRNHGDYSAVGASGAISGIIFASIALHPGMRVGAILLPISIPGWLFGLVYVLYSIYGIRSSRDNIGHEAHLGGALVGILVTLLFYPAAVVENLFTIAVILVPMALFTWVIITKPQFLLVDNFWLKNHYNYTVDDRYNLQKKNTQQEVDRILDKISKRGINSLSRKEREVLEDYSRK
ncbi:MAG TPA: rhomboid family intramembrane serine protease [Chitinophagaceae bacterium]|nr:rhomboid family intramembrane serine protease [Chitinophagaceae bacterium]